MIRTPVAAIVWAASASCSRGLASGALQRRKRRVAQGRQALPCHRNELLFLFLPDPARWCGQELPEFRVAQIPGEPMRPAVLRNLQRIREKHG